MPSWLASSGQREQRLAGAFRFAAGDVSASFLRIAPACEDLELTPPVVDAGPDALVVLPDELQLAGEVTDDGLPPGASLVLSWAAVSGPAPVAFSAASQAQTAAALAGTVDDDGLPSTGTLTT